MAVRIFPNGQAVLGDGSSGTSTCPDVILNVDGDIVYFSEKKITFHGRSISSGYIAPGSNGYSNQNLGMLICDDCQIVRFQIISDRISLDKYIHVMQNGVSIFQTTLDAMSKDLTLSDLPVTQGDVINLFIEGHELVTFSAFLYLDRNKE